MIKRFICFYLPKIYYETIILKVTYQFNNKIPTICNLFVNYILYSLEKIIDLL